MIKVGEHITLDFLGVKKVYSAGFWKSTHSRCRTTQKETLLSTKIRRKTKVGNVEERQKN